MNPRIASATIMIICVLLAILPGFFPYADAEQSSDIFPRSITMSPVPPEPISIYVVLGWLAVVVAIVAVAAALVLKKRRKLTAAVASVVFAAIAIAALLWFTQASVYYSFDSAHNYPRAGDNYITLNCKNTGYAEGTFSLVIQFVNANFSSKTNQPYERLSDSAAKFTYALRGGEKQSTKVYFSIHENVTTFYISLTYQQSGDAFLIQSDPDGDTYLSYVKEPYSENFGAQEPPPPP